MLPRREQTDCLFPQQRHKGMVIPMVLFEAQYNTGRRNPPPWHSVSSNAELLGAPRTPCALAAGPLHALLLCPETQFPSSGETTTYLLRFRLGTTFSRRHSRPPRLGKLLPLGPIASCTSPSQSSDHTVLICTGLGPLKHWFSKRCAQDNSQGLRKKMLILIFLFFNLILF